MLNGFDGRFALRLRPHRGPARIEEASDDPDSLRLKGRAMIAEGRCQSVDLLSWNVELNDWIRMETLAPGSSGALWPERRLG